MEGLEAGPDPAGSSSCPACFPILNLASPWGGQPGPPRGSGGGSFILLWTDLSHLVSGVRTRPLGREG